MLKIYFRRFIRNKLAIAGFSILFIITLVAIASPIVAPHDPSEQNILDRLSPPSSEYPMGTDDLGRDVLSRIIYGARISITVGFVAVSISIIIGTILGLFGGYFGGWIDTVIMRVVDIFLCIPTLFLILAVLAALEPNIYNVMIVIGLTSWPGLTRLVRGEVLSVRERDYITASRALGVPTYRIIFLHVLPNVVAPILVSATLGVGSAILVESGLSFLGLGVQPPTPSWGNILTAGKEYIHEAWWLSLFPGLGILTTVMAFNLLGEGLRDVLDPRL